MSQYRYLMGLISLLIAFSAQAGPISADKLLSNPDFRLVRMSPDGQYLSSQHVTEEHNYFQLIDLNTRKIVHQVDLLNNTTLVDYEWLNNDYLLFNVKRHGIKSILIGEKKDNKIAFTVLHVKGHLVDTYKASKNEVIFAKRDEDDYQRNKLFIINIGELKDNDFSLSKEIEQDDESHQFFNYDENTNTLLTISVDTEYKRINILYLPLKGGDWQALGSLVMDDFPIIPVDFINSKKLAVLTNHDTDKIVLREYDLVEHKFGKIIYQHPEFDLTNAKFKSDGTLEFIAFEKNGLNIRNYFNSAKDKISKRLYQTFLEQEVYITGHTADNNRFLLFANGSQQPGEYYLYQKDEDLIYRLFNIFPEINKEKLSSTNRLTVNSKDGLEIEAFLTLPKDMKYQTLLVMPHGGPIDVKESDRFNPEVQFYSSRGFAVLRVNFRGSSGFGKSFMEKGVGEFGNKIEQDITAAVDTIQSRYNFKHICSIGGSYGAYSATMLAIKQPNRYQCVIGSFGVYDLPLLFNDSNFRLNDENQKAIEQVVGKYSDSLYDVSPVNLVSELQAPILLIAGYNDKIARFEHTNRLKYLLEKINHPVETLFYRDTKHGHQTWTGDRLDAAVSYDFLMNTLNLDFPSAVNLSKDDRSAVAADYINIADAFNFDDKVDNDYKKALSFYRKAAEYGSARAQHMIGLFYERGEIVEYDLVKAKKWFLQASQNGFAYASYHLGQLYDKGVLGENDASSALAMYQLAGKQGYKLAYLEIAKASCLGNVVKKNVISCIEILKLDKRKNNRDFDEYKPERVRRNKIIEEIAWQNKFSVSESLEFKSLLTKLFKVNLFDVQLNLDSEGIFFKSKRYPYSDKHHDTTQNIPIEKGIKFGVRVKFEHDDTPGNRQSYTAVKVRWVTPKLTDKRGVVIKKPASIFYPKLGKNMDFLYVLSEDRELIEGEWKLEIFTLDDKLLYKKIFFTIKD